MSDASAAPSEAPPSPQGEPEPLPSRTTPARRWLLWLAVGALLVLGLVVRMHAIADSPFVYHPTRQLHSALIARTTYLERVRPADDPERVAARLAASREERLEAPITEEVVAGLYQLTGGERLWLAGLWSSLVWSAGALAVLALLRRCTNPVGQVAGVAAYLLLPLGVEAGRAFQPDPTMVALILATVLAVVRHHEAPTWRRLAVAGACGGAAVLVKAMALPLVVIAFVALATLRRGWLGAVRDAQTWAYGASLLAPVALATAVGWSPSPSGRSEHYFIGSLLTTRDFYSGVWSMLADEVGILVLVVALIGTAVAPPVARRVLLALWVGYLGTLLAFNYRMATHSYYHLALVPIVALGWGLAVGALQTWLGQREFRVARWTSGGALVAALGAVVVLAWASPSRIAAGRDPIGGIEEASEVTGKGARVLGMTDSYGRELAYYGWMDVRGELPSAADKVLLDLQGKPIPELEDLVADAGVDYVVVSSAARAVADPFTINALEQRYRMVGVGRGWAVFDVREDP